MSQDIAIHQGEPLGHGADDNGEYNGRFEFNTKEEERDVEIARGYFQENEDLGQGLQQRHIQMIALAGAIGTGLFLGSGSALAKGGPLGAFLGYTLTGILASGVVLAAGEMATLVPLSGGTVRFAEIFADPALAFAYGWNSVYSYMVLIPNELVAAAALWEFWFSINNAIWITIFGLIIAVCSSFFVRVYGEVEFGLALLKIFLIVFVNILAIVITCGGGPTGETIGFKYWVDPGPFVQYLEIPGALGRFLGFWSTFNSAVYSYAGIENITIAASEVVNPRQAIPKAAKRIFWRIFLFYVITIFMVTLIVASNNTALLTNSNTAASPFVVAATNAGIKVVPSIINAIVITSAFSAGNSAMLAGTRTLYGLARQGRAPKIFTRVNRYHIPYVTVAFFTLFMCLGYMTLSASAATVFGWLLNLVSVGSLINWSILLITYLRFYYGCKVQGIARSELPWAAPFQPYLSWVALSVFLLLLITGGYSTFIVGHWSTATFVSSYINIPIVVLLYLGYRFTMKSRMIPLHEIPIRPFIQVALENPEPIEEPKRGLARLNILWS